MPSNYVVVTEVPVAAPTLDATIRNWAPRIDAGAGLYRSVGGSTLLELRGIESLEQLSAIADGWRELGTALAPGLTGDFRRSVHEFVEAPKTSPHALPDTPYVQLRSVQVKPPMLSAYRDWRERTIFDVVRRSPDVEVFFAYHSVLSTEPGVLFISGFKCAPEQHAATFTTAEYEAILRQARDTYIVPRGGDRGLFLASYARIET
jgi:hypothetical protein